MVDVPTALLPAHPARMKLEPYSAEIRLTTLAVGIDNIHYDVFLSPRFVEFARKYLLDLVRQTANLSLFYGAGSRSFKPPETGAFRRMLSELSQTGLTQAKFENNLELDLLFRLALVKFLTQEAAGQFSSLVVECKDWLRNRGEQFEHSEQAHVMRSRIAELQADRKNVYRQVCQSLLRTLVEIEDNALTKSRRALFGEDFPETYDLFKNRLLFVEGGSDDSLFLEHYVLLGNFLHDPDRFEAFDTLLLEFVHEFVLAGDQGEEMSKARKAHERLLEQARVHRAELARLEEEAEEALRKVGGGDELFSWPWKKRGNGPPGAQKELSQLRRRQEDLQKKLQDLAPQLDTAKRRVEFLDEEYRSRLGDYLNRPENAQRIMNARAPADSREHPAPERQLLDEWLSRLEERDLLIHMLASYEVRNLYKDYCPPIHLQQLKKVLVVREEAKRVEQILQQFPARGLSMKRIEDSSRALRRCPREEARAASLRFAEDLMRLRRDRRNYQHVTAWLERINLVRDERSRELSRTNRSLYEFLLPGEARPAEDAIINHTVIKADVRGSTQITKDLLARGLNPASHFSLNLHEPVKRILERYGAAKVFLEGDAIILAIYETESTRATQRAVAKASVLAREILAVSQAYNDRAAAEDLPRLELGVGVAYQNSPPSLWSDGDSRIMISRAINLSDRLSSCAKMARRLIANNPSPFNVFLLETVVEGASEEESEELLIRYNLNGVELNEEGFEKLGAEISISPLEGTFPMPWGKERVQLYFGEVPLGESLVPIVIRKGVVRHLEPGGEIGGPGTRPYYEICTSSKLTELAQRKIAAVLAKR